MPKVTTEVISAGVSASLDDCMICCESFGNADENWKLLPCDDHKVCTNCFNEIETTGTTMSGITHTSVKCPFCQIVSGIIIGTCPTGDMKATKSESHCEGYEDCGSIQIHYSINDGNYYLNRVAYLPDNAEGNKMLKLLEIAWDRRISFTIGTSVTTGQEDTVVWNLHHKTSLTGGVACFGYPDSTYFQRLRLELEANGIATD